MKTQKIMLEVIWQSTVSMQNAGMLADELSDLVEKALKQRGLEGAAFASPVGR